MSKSKAQKAQERGEALGRIADSLAAAEQHAEEGNPQLSVPAVVAAVREMNALLDAIAPGDE